MRPMLQAAAESKWGRTAPLVDRILHVKSGERCIIVGTVYKEMRAKPNILDEYHAREQYEAPPPERSKYVETDDAAVLEDDSGRIIVGGAFPLGRVVSGASIACRLRPLHVQAS